MHQSCPAKTIGRSPSPSITPNTAKGDPTIDHLDYFRSSHRSLCSFNFFKPNKFYFDLIRALLPLYKTKP